ncbi:myrosinase 1-like isoform X2 [Manduca sexta]|uniref:myrosinase 1-like isoform X2 n=1 Tax=Manduca sexta TaxID=7130 RepID=UPI00188FB82A|nr:myrosinase 1-like isoform X2 [Manduca sexta]
MHGRYYRSSHTCKSLLAVTVTCEDLDFPPGFQFGAASAAYQVEGAWNVSDKSENIWDRLVRDKPELIADRSTGDVACDSYHLWRRDVEMTADLGLHFYRISIAWTRLLPNGFANKISEDGLNYYNNVIDGLLEKGIQPMVTLYHWDLPQSLQDLGGWTNPLIVNWFGNYARIAFSLFGDRVKTWITINEPLIMCDVPYNTGSMAPAIVNPDVGAHLCAKNVLMAHAKAWRIYDKEFRPKYHGELSLANHLIWYEPFTPEDEEITETAREYMAGRYSHPIYSKEGGWPPVIEKIMAENSKAKGYSESNLPAFTKEEIDLVRGTFDFYAVNHYTSRHTQGEEGEEFGAFRSDVPDVGAKYEINPDWKPTTSSWFFVYPEGLRNQIVWLREQYGDMKFIVTENGYARLKGLDDTDRIEYYTEYLKQLLLAMKVDHVNVSGYTHWSLMDNFEWLDGYTSKFGLYEVNFTDPMRERTPRASANYYSKIIKQRKLDICC